ncbi:Chemotaxis protein methyltransferase [Candidatus Magnetomoraceae bacterium gMMP-15]
MLQTPNLTEEDFKLFSNLIYQKCGIYLHEGKKELVRSRLNKRLRETGISSFKSYYKFLTQKDNGDELIWMLDAISTNKTSFFREKKHFDFLNEKVFPLYSSGKYGKRLRFWSAASSSGEEPYTLAISLLEHFNQSYGFDMKILASDISTKVLKDAQRGVYPAERLEDVPLPMQSSYFQKGYGRQAGFFKVKSSLMNMVKFKRINLMDPFPFKAIFNFIFCRNVMIYFDKKTQEHVVNKFYDCMTPEGYLMIGHSESLTGIKHCFKYIQPSIYQKTN